MTFTHDRLHLRHPVADGDVVLTLRTSGDGAHWGDWYTTDLLSDGDGDARRAGPSPSRYGPAPAAYVQVAGGPGGHGAPPAALRGVKLVAIDTDGGGGAKDAVLGVVRAPWPPSRRSA